MRRAPHDGQKPRCNLFNLVPLLPFDSGRIPAVLGTRIWRLGVPVLGALFLYKPSALLLLIALLAAPQVWKAIRYRKGCEETRTYYAVSTHQKWAYGLQYLLLVFLSLMTHDVHEMLQASAAARGHN